MRADKHGPSIRMLLNFITKFKLTDHGLPALRQALSVVRNFMRALLLMILISILLSCNQSEKVPSKTPDAISGWLMENEEILHKDILSYIREDSSLHPNDQDWFERQYELFDTTRPVGQFTKMVMQKSDCIGVRYVYNKRETPNAKILITANYQKRCVTIVDSILNTAGQLKLFAIQKFEPASDEMTLYQFEEGLISSKDIAAQVENQSIPYYITFFVKSKSLKLTDDLKEDLTKQILGEEAYLKKVGSVTWRPDTSIKTKVLTIGELQRLLAEKDIAQQGL